MIESDGTSFAKGLLGHLLVFLVPNIIFVDQLEKDIGLRLHVAQ